MLTARDEDIGPGAGEMADDYLAKPVQLRVAKLAHIKAILQIERTGTPGRRRRHDPVRRLVISQIIRERSNRRHRR